jgi:hypothetical protein
VQISWEFRITPVKAHRFPYGNGFQILIISQTFETGIGIFFRASNDTAGLSSAGRPARCTWLWCSVVGRIHHTYNLRIL